MSITKNPFEHHFRGRSDKGNAEKPTVASVTGKEPPAAPETAAPKKPVTHGGGLPPTRKGSAKSEEAPAPAPAGFQKANPFKTPKHPGVSHTKPPEEKPVSWQPEKLPVDPATIKPPALLATTAQGHEVIVPNIVEDDFTKRIQESGKEVEVKSEAEVELTGDNYQKVYLAQQQAEAERREAERLRQLDVDLAQQKKRAEQAFADTHKARELMAKMASLQLKLLPNMDPAESYRIHGEIEEVRVALAQLQVKN